MSLTEKIGKLMVGEDIEVKELLTSGMALLGMAYYKTESHNRPMLKIIASKLVDEAFNDEVTKGLEEILNEIKPSEEGCSQQNTRTH